jgi:hypothetical protein
MFLFSPRGGGARGLAPWLLRLPLLGVWSLGHVLILVLRCALYFVLSAVCVVWLFLSSAFFLSSRSRVA